MSNFFDQLTTGFTNAGRTVSQKMKNLNDTNKLTGQVKSEQHNIQQNLIAIGQKYYDLCRDNPDEDFREMVEAIMKSEKAIAQLQQEIESVRAREPELMPVPQESSQTTVNVNITPGQYDTIYQQSPAQNPAPVQDEPTVQEAIYTTTTEPEPKQATEPELHSDFNSDLNTPSAFCPYCGKNLSSTPNAIYCPECGQAISQ